MITTLGHTPSPGAWAPPAGLYLAGGSEPGPPDGPWDPESREEEL